MKSDSHISIAVIIIAILVIYYSIAGFVFDIRNPTANNAAKITHIVDVIKFNKLEKFQGNEK